MDQAKQDNPRRENLHFLIDLVIIAIKSLKSWRCGLMKWHETIQKDFADMIQQKVWQNTSKSLMPLKQRCITFKWVLKLNGSGVHCAKFVACSSSQVLSVNFSKTNLSFVNDIVF